MIFSFKSFRQQIRRVMGEHPTEHKLPHVPIRSFTSFPFKFISNTLYESITHKCPLIAYETVKTPSRYFIRRSIDCWSLLGTSV